VGLLGWSLRQHGLTLSSVDLDRLQRKRHLKDWRGSCAVRLLGHRVPRQERKPSNEGLNRLRLDNLLNRRRCRLRGLLGEGLLKYRRQPGSHNLKAFGLDRYLKDSWGRRCLRRLTIIPHG
jgi:hypothetical protein